MNKYFTDTTCIVMYVMICKVVNTRSNTVKIAHALPLSLSLSLFFSDILVFNVRTSLAHRLDRLWCQLNFSPGEQDQHFGEFFSAYSTFLSLYFTGSDFCTGWPICWSSYLLTVWWRHYDVICHLYSFSWQTIWRKSTHGVNLKLQWNYIMDRNRNYFQNMEFRLKELRMFLCHFWAYQL